MELSALIDQAEALIFDCDGTLVESGVLYAEAWSAGFRSCGFDMSAAWYHDHSGLSEGVLIKAFEKEIGAAINDHRFVVNAVRQTFTAELSRLTEVAVVTEIARRFYGSKPLAVASGGPRPLVEASLVKLGLFNLFDAVVTVDDVQHPKPAPDLFLEAARRLAVSPAACVAFEDSPHGLAAARSAGLVTIDVAHLQLN